MNLPYRLILASNSPRRKELLTRLNLKFEVRPVDVVEDYPDSLDIQDIPVFLSQKKANAFPLKEGELVITADTIVALNGDVLGKPSNTQSALIMLNKLSGTTHDVISGVTLRTTKRDIAFHDITQVTFKSLSDQEIEYYVEKCYPFDKAGAYGIQDWIGMIGIIKMNGSYYNVMGLPTHLVYQHLLELSNQS